MSLIGRASLLGVVAALTSLSPLAAAPGPWKTLFDGKSTDAWRGYGRDAFPTSDPSFGLTCRVYATPDGLAGCPTTEPSDVVLSCPVITSLKGPSGQEPGSSTL